MRLPDGAIYAPRLRGPGDDVLHRQYHVRRISRETVRSAPAAQTSCVGRSSRKKNRPRVLRLLGPRQSKTVVLNCSGGRCSSIATVFYRFAIVSSEKNSVILDPLIARAPPALEEQGEQNF